MAPKGKDDGSPFDMFKNMGDMRDIRKILGDDFFKNFPLPQWQQFNNDAESDDDFPRYDMYERGEEVFLTVEVPGLTGPSDIHIAVTSNCLYLKGSIPGIPSRDASVHVSERFHGPFDREIDLPVRVREDDVSASYSKGLLTIRLVKQSVVEGPESSIPVSFE